MSAKKPAAKKAKSKPHPAARKAAPSAAKTAKKAPPRAAGARFKVGSMVVYPFHGVGVIRSLDKLNVTGEEKWYYTLDFRNGELTVKLPVDQQDERGMRHVIGRSDVQKIFATLRKKPTTEETDWKIRYNLYLEKLKSGDIHETAKVARNLAKRGPEGELSMSEKRLLEASMQLLIHEIASASNEAIEKVESEINKCLRGTRS